MTERVRTRETGVRQGEYVTRVAEMEEILDRAQLEDFTVANENRPVVEVALDMLVRAGWISS
jgi:hypothetical protein